jgi:hypothetical protein
VVLTALRAPFFLGALARKTTLVHSSFAVPLLMIYGENPKKSKVRRKKSAKMLQVIATAGDAVESCCFFKKKKNPFKFLLLQSVSL